MKIPENVKMTEICVITWERDKFPKVLDIWKLDNHKVYLLPEKFIGIWLLSKYRKYFKKGPAPDRWRLIPKTTTTLSQIEDMAIKSQLLNHVKKI